MERLVPAALFVVVIMSSLSGYLGAQAQPGQAPGACDKPGQAHGRNDRCDARELDCAHPYPCGDEWPEGLEGPFALREIQRVKVESHDGTMLDGWIFLPDLPEGVRAPAVLISLPYWGTRVIRHGDSQVAGNLPTNEEVRRLPATPIDALVVEGYAVAAFSVRGTGNSAGCFENKGQDEARDHYVLVEWLAAQPWSSGRVGTYGLSYGGITGLFAGTENPPSLKTVLAIAPLVDQYVADTTPQGAFDPFALQNMVTHRFGVSAMPHILGGLDDPDFLVGQAEVYPERLCDEYRAVLVNQNKGFAGLDDRDGTFWDERNRMRHVQNMTAAVWWVHGFQDGDTGSQEDPVWPFLTGGPRRMLLGQWGHRVPPQETWVAEAIVWFDYWLKGKGDQPRLEVVDFETSDETWLSSTSWPPQETQAEVLFMTNGALSGSPSEGNASFVAAPTASGPDGTFFGLVCGEEEAVRPYGLVFVSEPLEQDVLLAGNPFTFLRLESSQPAGLVSVDLYDMPAWPSCDGHRKLGVPEWLMGSADLRFFDGNYVAQDYPVGEAMNVRIDLPNLADRVPAGDRILAIVSYGGGQINYAPPPYPVLTVHGGPADIASQLVLPVLEGTVGGASPSVKYPPRPFLPEP